MVYYNVDVLLHSSLEISYSGTPLIASVCAKKFPAFLVPDDGTNLHSVVTVAIRADDFLRIGFIDGQLFPAGHHLLRRDVIRLVAALALTESIRPFRFLFQPVSYDIPG